MGLRKAYLKRLVNPQAVRQKKLDEMDVNAQIEKLCKIVNYRPQLEIYNGVFPESDEQLQTMKKYKMCQGIIILFDPLRDVTDLAEIVRLRPLLVVSNGHTPKLKTMFKQTDNRACDGYLILFKALNKREKFDVFGAEEIASEEVDEGEATAV